MPEGDTIWHTARRLRGALAGRVLTHADLRVPDHATADLRGRVVTSVAARGKHLLIRMDSEITLHTHLGIGGTWRLSRFRGRVPGPNAASVRVILANEEWLAVGDDVPRVDLVPTTDEDRLVGHLGPDLLGPDWDAEAAARNLAADPDRSLSAALLDQANLAGIGNVYRNELLFLRGIHPSAAVRDAGDLDRLVRLARRLLWVNREYPVHATTGDRHPDRRHWVYGRGGAPCRRCGTPIASGRYDEPGSVAHDRITYWCPHCQPQVRCEPQLTG